MTWKHRRIAHQIKAVNDKKKCNKAKPRLRRGYVVEIWSFRC